MRVKVQESFHCENEKTMRTGYSQQGVEKNWSHAMRAEETRENDESLRLLVDPGDERPPLQGLPPCYMHDRLMLPQVSTLRWLIPSMWFI